MTVDELLTRCDLVRASEKKLSECKPFSCGDEDLNRFFDKQSSRAERLLNDI